MNPFVGFVNGITTLADAPQRQRPGRHSNTRAAAEHAG
jgi:hypothetical protein